MMLQDSWKVAVEATAEQEASISFPLQNISYSSTFKHGAQVLRTFNALQCTYMTCHGGNLLCFHATLSVPCCGQQRLSCRPSHEMNRFAAAHLPFRRDCVGHAFVHLGSYQLAERLSNCLG